jgi:branched-chain amino acid transport system ATP-binding protein
VTARRKLRRTQVSTLLEVENLTAGYGETTVVRELSFTLESGEILALLGPNGAGKTTTLLTLSNLVPALGGSAKILGSDVRSTPPEKLALTGLGHVPEDRSLFTRLTVRDNLVLAAGKDKTVVNETMDLFPALHRCLRLKAGALSGGEQQMLVIARALTQKPKVLMIDEMSMGLAPLIVEDLLRIVRRIADESGTAILLVEQHVNLALSAADRGIVLVHGRAVREGSASELKSDASLESTYFGDPGASSPASAVSDAGESGSGISRGSL